MGRHAIMVIIRAVLLIGLLMLFAGSLINSLLADPTHSRPVGSIGPDPGLRVLIAGTSEQRSHARLAIAPLQEGLLYCPDDKESWFIAVDPPHEIILTPQGRDGIMVQIPSMGGYTQTWPVARLAFISRHFPTDEPLKDLAAVEANNRQAVFGLNINGNHYYRGNLEITLFGAIGLHAVNALPIEAWLEGVLQAELPSSWPDNAMRAQAIAARSYAFAKTWERRRHNNSNDLRFDLSDSGNDPTYRGTGSGNRRIDWAIADTHGKILTYYGRAFAAHYHAASGGHTAPISHLIEDARTADQELSIESVMPAQVDNWYEIGIQALDGEARYGERTTRIKIADLKERLNEAGYNQHTVFRIAAALSDGNHAREVTLRIHHGSDITMSGHAFRKLVGLDVIRSSLWTDESPRMEQGEVWITSIGRGHGVGMSQVSAYAMAEAGWHYNDILRFFYVGSDIKQEW